MKATTAKTEDNTTGAVIDFAPALHKALLATIRSAEFVELLAEVQSGRPEPPKFFNAKATAEHFGVSPALISKLKREGSIPFLIVGMEARFDLSEVEKALRNRQAEKAGSE